MEFRVQLDSYHGPVDLLLYLVRKQELEAVELPLARIAEQFLEFVAVLTVLDVDAVGEFLDAASTLLELKSRDVLPQVEELEEDLESPRHDLVRKLLEFKKYRDAATRLEEHAHEWRQQFPRIARDLPTRQITAADQPITGVELWDLVSAFGRVMREKLDANQAATNIRYDDTPIHVFMEQIYSRLMESDSSVAFSELFPGPVHKSTLVGMFLGVLELTRQLHALAEQLTPFGEIWLRRGTVPYTAAA
jgi:segregation and condensation protein A